jgi:Concanavalin A-like lectin/glucanases superfamily
MSANGNGNALTANQSGQSGIFQQILMSIVWVFIVYLALMFVEIIYQYINRLSINRTVLMPYTYITDDKSIIIPQNPNTQGAKTVHISDNERSGIEFSYSFYLYVHPSTFRQELGLLHIFHKGYSSQFPLLAPGVYMRSDTNTLRVYMNTFKTWNNFVEVDNIPIQKWVHIVIVCKNNALEIFINGNLTRKMSFDGYAPYQNYQDIVCFSNRILHLTNSQVPSTDNTGFDVFGVMKGMLSRLNYFNYALCYAEIQTLMNEGPSSKMDSGVMNNVPPYLDDTWWAQGY